MNLNGLQSCPPRTPGLFQRLFGRPVKDNAIIEVTNLLAENDIQSVTLPQVADILRNYDVGFAESRSQFLEIFHRVLLYLARDRALSLEDHAILAHLQMILKLSDADATGVREGVLGDLYGKSLADAIGDGHIMPEERTRLDAISASFGLPRARVEDLYKSQVTRLMQLSFDQAISDRRMTGDEESRLKAMAENLGVTLTHDATTKALIERFTRLAKIETGDLPVLSPPIKLQRGEACHASLSCTHHEIRTRTTSYRHSGISTSIKIIGNVRWRVGQVAVQRVTRDEMVQLDAGILYITNKRLLFDGAKKNTAISLGKIVRFTLFNDGLRIEKDSGRDQYFLGEADLEVVSAVLEMVITGSR